MPVLVRVLEHLDRELPKYTVLLPVADSLDNDFFFPLSGDGLTSAS